jgi:hypothetical protein
VLPRKIPNLAALLLHGDAGGIADIDPDGTPISTIHLLRDDAFGAKPTSVRKDGSAVFSNVFVEKDAGRTIAQEPRQRSFPVQEREVAKSLFDQVECIDDRGVRCLSSAQ